MRSCSGWLVFPYLQRLTVRYCYIKKMQKNYSVLRIAETLELDEAFVQLIFQIAKQMAPDYDVEKVMELYQKKNMGSDEQ